MGGGFLTNGQGGHAALDVNTALGYGNTGVSQGSFQSSSRRREWLNNLMFSEVRRKAWGAVYVRSSQHQGVKGRKISPGLFKLESESRKDRFLVPLPNINPSCLFD